MELDLKSSCILREEYGSFRPNQENEHAAKLASAELVEVEHLISVMVATTQHHIQLRLDILYIRNVLINCSK